MLCAPCRAAIRPVGPVRCLRGGAPTAWPVERCRECEGRRLAFATARAAATYSGSARALVGAWKEHGLRRAAALAAEVVAERLAPPAADVITYIPPDPGRLLQRGYHPAEQLARELARRWSFEAAPLLARHGRHAVRQADLTREERSRNVRGAFVPVADAPKRVLLVDDVYTTGSTVSAAATELRRAGARTVDVVTFARTVRT